MPLWFAGIAALCLTVGGILCVRQKKFRIAGIFMLIAAGFALMYVIAGYFLIMN